MEMCAHSLAASRMCWAAAPPHPHPHPLSSWGKTPRPRGFKEWKYTVPVASGSAYLMEGIWLQLGKYLNFKYIHWENKYLQTYVVCKNKTKLLDMILMYLYRAPPFYFILCTIYRFKETMICIA